MRRSALLGTILLTAGLLMGGPPPAQASYTGSCNGHGLLGTASGLRSAAPGFPPVIQAPTTTSYYFWVQGVCATTFGLITTEFWGTGVITGFCENWSGTGTINSDHEHSHHLVGTTWTIGLPGTTFGEAAGSFQVVLDPTMGGSCISGTARAFRMVGGVGLR